MGWKFWKRENEGIPSKVKKLSRPKELPDLVGRKLVVELKLDPDEAWSLRYVSRPSEGQSGIQEFRLFDPNKASKTGVTVKDWVSLDDYPDLILYQGRYDRNNRHVDFQPVSITTS